MIGTNRSVGARRPVEGTSAALAVVDAGLGSVGSRDTIQRDEAIELLGAVLTAVTETDPSDAPTAIAKRLVDASADALLIGTPQVADALLDIRLALSRSS